MTTSAATALAIPIFDELTLIEQRAALARKGWVRLLLLVCICLQVAVSAFAWRASVDGGPLASAGDGVSCPCADTPVLSAWR